MAIQVVTRHPYKAMNLLAMLYLTFFLLSAVLANRLALYGSTTGSAATLIFPFTYLCADVVAEVYGYKMARQLIWFGLFCEFLFAFSAHFLIKLPHPETWKFAENYFIVLDPLLRITLASILATLVGSFANIYLLTKWKLLVKGKYFWLRSLLSSTFGELLFTIIADLVIFYGKVPTHSLLEIMCTSYLFKLIFSPIVVIPAAMAVFFLKKMEKIEATDSNTSFTPFSISVD